MKLPLRQSDEAVSELEACLFPNAQWLGFLIIYEDSDCGNEAMDLFRDLSGKISRRKGEIVFQQIGLNRDPQPTVAALQKLF